MFLTDSACHLGMLGNSFASTHAHVNFVFASARISARMIFSKKGQHPRTPRSYLRPVTSNFTQCILANVGNVLGKVIMANGKRCVKGTSAVGVWERTRNSGATGAWSNNSLDAPPRSLVTRTVRAFYSARGHFP